MGFTLLGVLTKSRTLFSSGGWWVTLCDGNGALILSKHTSLWMIPPPAALQTMKVHIRRKSILQRIAPWTISWSVSTKPSRWLILWKVGKDTQTCLLDWHCSDITEPSEKRTSRERQLYRWGEVSTQHPKDTIKPSQWWKYILAVYVSANHIGWNFVFSLCCHFRFNFQFHLLTALFLWSG